MEEVLSNSLEGLVITATGKLTIMGSNSFIIARTSSIVPATLMPITSEILLEMPLFQGTGGSTKNRTPQQPTNNQTEEPMPQTHLDKVVHKDNQEQGLS